MKTRIVLIINILGLLLLATSCTTSVTWVTSGSTPISWLSGGTKLISPDGQWLATFIHQSNGDVLRISSTIDPKHVIDSTPNGNIDMISWSPNNTSFLAANYNMEAAPCRYRNIVIYNLENNSTTLSQVQFGPASNDNENCFASAWSPDGKKLAVSFNYRVLYIIDIYGQVLKNVSNLSTTGYPLEFWWTAFGLIYRVSNNTTYEFRLINPNTPDKYSILFGPVGGYLDAWGSDPNKARLFFSISSDSDHDQEIFHLQVLDIKTKKIEFKKDMQGEICTSNDSRGVAYTALQIAEPGQPCGGITYLWVYDWQRGKLTKLSQIAALLGWRDNPQGFAVVTGSDNIGYKMAIVSPK
jgi:hypothetical protein